MTFQEAKMFATIAYLQKSEHYNSIRSALLIFRVYESPMNENLLDTIVQFEDDHRVGKEPL